jgi:putative PIG3 family NAD(P)H quinone oxidoreductase
MRAILPTQQPLRICEVPLPQLKPHEVLIKVHAAGVNRADILQCKGHYPPPVGESQILGLEVAGEVIDIGSACEHTKLNSRVFALLAGGGYAQYAAVDENLLMPVPSDFSFEQAAAIAEVFLTAYQAIFWLGSLKKDETVLIHAGAGGVGTAAIQVAKQINAQVVVTTSNGQKSDACKKLGADHVINYREADFAQALLEITNHKGADVIIDSIGASYLKQNLHALAMDGRLVMLALQGGSNVDQLNLGTIISKRLSLIGSTLRNRHMDYKSRLVAEFTRSYLPLFDTKTMTPVIHEVMDWQEAERAHRLIESNQTIGKIILTGMSTP